VTVRIQDQCRGKLPVIRTEPDAITFVMAIDMPEGLTPELILRGEQDGEIRVSLRWKAPKARR
jgi:hypothetical protein